jgi:CheY-like chemotaxis protein/HPt (histidine-containing phosphotransfer) domain-containing protein
MGKILVADDNPLSLDFFCEAIALAAAREQHFDLLVLDARMPGLNGVEVLAEIRANNGVNQLTPTLLSTADGALDRNLARSQGFVDILHKPIGLAALHALLARHLPTAADRARTGDVLDDALAAEKTGGDASIIAALRGLFASELDALPDELDRFSATVDREGLYDRLHRLDASAGFCGAPALGKSIAALRERLDADASWPHAALAELLSTCMDTRRALG